MGEKLKNLYKEVDACSFCKQAKNFLNHIHGYGAMEPRLMLVLVNPTHRNISAHAGYEGPRFPFLGVRQFWKVLADGGLMSKSITADLPLRAGWNSSHTSQLQKELISNKLFLTNVVKCCYNHSAYPEKPVIKDGIKKLAQEINIVKPEKIVAFGALVFESLTGQQIKLKDHDGKAGREIISGLEVPVIPCYFPVGRGKPQKAIKILQRLI